MFNSLKYAKILEGAGIPRNQAETHIQIISEVLEEELATKRDVENIQNDIHVLSTRVDKMDDRMSSLEKRLDSFEHRVDEKFEQFEYKIVFKLGSLMVLLFGSTVGVITQII